MTARTYSLCLPVVIVLAWLGGCATHADVPAPRPTAASEDVPVAGPKARAMLDAAARAHPVAFLDRIGWGADAAQLRQLSLQGASHLLDEQLDPRLSAALPPDVAAQLAALPVNQPLTELIPPIVRHERAIRRGIRGGAGTDAEQTQAALRAVNRRKSNLTRQAMAEQLLLAVYARDQLRQRLVWFWANHFNVFRDGNVGPMMADYTQRVIAPHALGRFRGLLSSTMFSPQMLLYLNNAQNARGHINENYAREVMELHTLGVGSGYSQTDVTNLAYVLTGLGVDLSGRPVRVRPALRGLVWRRGLVVFNPARHDPRPKMVLGRVLGGRGLQEIDAVIALLADSPATARHVSFELAQYFVADHPDPSLVAAMTDTWLRSHGDIGAVLRTMFFSPQFAASLARPQFKDPVRYVVSAVRATFDGRIITDPQPMIGMLARLAEPLYGHRTPDGYPLSSVAWDSPGQLTARFEVARQIGAGAAALFRAIPAFMGVDDMESPPAPPPPPSIAGARRQPPPDLSSSPVFQAVQPQLRRATLEALADAPNRVSWNALWLSSPEFMND